MVSDHVPILANLYVWWIDVRNEIIMVSTRQAEMGILISYLSFFFVTTCCSDWNGSKRGHVYKFLRSQGFESTYDIAHKYTDNDLESHKVSIYFAQNKISN